MHIITRITIMVLAAGLLGLGSAFWMIGPYSADTAGTWRIWVSRVMPNHSPYALAHYALNDMVSPDNDQTATFIARKDSKGASLDGDCDYKITGTLPLARWWSLQVQDVQGGSVLHSDNVLIGADDIFQARISSQARPGNWLALPQTSGRFGLVLRFHGPVGDLKSEPQRVTLPSILREACR